MGHADVSREAERHLAEGTGDATRPAPAFYAHPRGARRGWAADAWTLLHPPYTAWHLASVVVGACLVGPVSVSRLCATLLAFFLAVGVGAHALDELQGRPLRTALPDRVLVGSAVVGLGGATALGLVGAMVVGPWLLAFVAAGLVLALGYNLELFGGVLHRDAWFAAAWGAFPVLTAAFAQHDAVGWPAVVAAAFAFCIAAAQRTLSTPARALRRRTSRVEGVIVREDGTREPLTAASMLAPLEAALKWLSWSMVALAVALAIAQLVNAR